MDRQYYKSLKAKVGGAAGAAVRAPRMRFGGWDNLTPGTRRLFQTRGLGRGLGSRTPTMAQRLYEKSVPRVIRNPGEGAVRDYLKGKHFSHKMSVANAPQRAKAPSNIVLENVRKNLARGRRNMTSAEVAAAKGAGRASASKILAKSALKSGAKAGVIAAAIEAPIAGLENYLHWRGGRKTGKQAAKDTAKSTAVAGGTGAAVSVPLMLIPLGPLGAPVAVVGGTLLVGNTIYRITMAAKPNTALAGQRLEASALRRRITRGRRLSRLRLGARSSR